MALEYAYTTSHTCNLLALLQFRSLTGCGAGTLHVYPSSLPSCLPPSLTFDREQRVLSHETFLLSLLPPAPSSLHVLSKLPQGLCGIPHGRIKLHDEVLNALVDRTLASISLILFTVLGGGGASCHVNRQSNECDRQNMYTIR